MSIFNNNRWMTIVVLLLLAANITTLVLLWNKGGTTGTTDRPLPVQGGGGGPFEYLVRELKLTDQQKEVYSKLRDEHRQKANVIEQGIRKAKDDYFGLLKTPNVSDSLLKPYLRQITEKEEELDLHTFRHFQQVRALCNAEQQQRFDAIIQEALHSMRPGRQGPPPGGPQQGPPHGDPRQGPPPPHP